MSTDELHDTEHYSYLLIQYFLLEKFDEHICRELLHALLKVAFLLCKFNFYSRLRCTCFTNLWFDIQFYVQCTNQHNTQQT